MQNGPNALQIQLGLYNYLVDHLSGLAVGHVSDAAPRVTSRET